MILHLFCCFHVIYDNSNLQADNKNNNNYNLIILYDLVSLSNVN